MKLRRLARMTIGEVLGRSRQEARKRLERARWSKSPVLRARDVSLANWAAEIPARFFEGTVVADARSLLVARWPAACEDIRNAAEQIRQKRFDLLGYRDLSFGDPVDWHFDPLS